ncbi:MAG: (2Fe-2S)-binding protein [Bacteroidia bacterium]|nr:(2Fe-2S)-binding protein [Bacteroidia bacterium]NNF30103.1 2Fe-2S iron-sulfur cluster binding domain-containing protein [Flavobacteriaceae bacterium]MBT8274981.1 (2Fe-2S)-binding protein [Bacteroidia bacterium]NNJ80599.1 2Fe-2S iron-sulfur cluster binding domain-containing protein [Flavobacteriaceae bacterium]NNK55534.1 2Fe-2S iron-sulfur cluster binding domain-containing protein [Flavobacteriaceae bacterium]
MTKMVNLKIDGKPIQAEAGMNLVDVAKQNGIYIPTLCYFKELNPLATCRICTVKVNGKEITGCTVKVAEGMDIEVTTPELLDNRKAIIEMLYAEGNHFCPSCEKSGNCDMQNLGYDMGITVTRYPHVFSDKIVDFNPKRMIMESNRCILCKRCVEEVKTKDGKDVFSFVQRGVKTRVQIDYEQEANLTEAEAIHAMNICPVGAILVKGMIHEQPFGERKYDLLGKDIKPVVKKDPLRQRDGGKFIVATTSLAGCFGCHMSLLDIDTELLDVLELVEFNKSPLTDIKKFSKQCHIGLVEGGCSNSENVEVLREFRKKCDILVGFGECAIMGGIPAMRNFVPLKECLDEAYLNGVTTEVGADVVPGHEDIPKLLNNVYPCNEVVKIDYYIPGCPPNAQHIWKVVKSILLGEEFSIAHDEFKYD